MNKRQKIVQQRFLDNEEAVTKALEKTYETALADVKKKIKNLQLDIDEVQGKLDVWDDFGGDKAEKEKLQSMLQSKIYQKRYQQTIQGQLDDVLDKMHTESYKTVDAYLNGCYDEAYIGAFYDMHGQGVPLVMPIDQEAVVRAVQIDSKISNGLYSRLGEDVAGLKKTIASEVSRGIANGSTYAQVAQQISFKMVGAYDDRPGGALYRALTIARTEGGRIQSQSALDACHKAKDIGADVVKQWDSTLDGDTRPSHRHVDGEIRELDEPFSNGLDYPRDPSGGAAEVVNCRCALLQRARWAIEAGFTKMNNFTKEIEFFDSPEEYDDFKKAFWSKENQDFMKKHTDLEKKYGTKDFKKLLESMDDKEYAQYMKLYGNSPIYNKAAKEKVYNNIDDINKELSLLEQRMANSFDFNEWVEIEDRQQFLEGEKRRLLKAQKTAEAKKAVSAAEDKLKSGYFINDPEKFVTQINLDGCDSQIADSVLSAFDKAFDRFPMLRGKFAGISMSNDLPDLAMAETTVGGWIKLNSRSFSEYSALLTKCKGNFANGVLVARNPEELVLHEIGHAFSMFAKYDWTTDEGYSATFVKGGTIAGRIKKAVQKECGAVDIGSRYAATNDDEWFAEAFTLYCTDRTDSPVMQSFSKQIEKIVKGLIK